MNRVSQIDPQPKPSLTGFCQIQIHLDWITTKNCYFYIFLSLKTSPAYFYMFPLLKNNEECKFLWQELQCETIELFMSCEINLKSASIQCVAQGLSERNTFVLCLTEFKSLSFSSVVSTEITVHTSVWQATGLVKASVSLSLSDLCNCIFIVALSVSRRCEAKHYHVV